MAATVPDAHYASAVHLSSGATLFTRVTPEEWTTLFARAASTKHEGDITWVSLQDGRRVLVQLRHVAFVEPAPDWKPRREPNMTKKSLATERTFGPNFTPD
jgi:hypothetical protein